MSDLPTPSDRAIAIVLALDDTLARCYRCPEDFAKQRDGSPSSWPEEVRLEVLTRARVIDNVLTDTPLAGRVMLYAEGLQVKIEEDCTVIAIRPTKCCPGCDRPGIQRHGPHFDHEWRCGYGCGLTWEPGAYYNLLRFNEKP